MNIAGAMEQNNKPSLSFNFWYAAQACDRFLQLDWS